MVVAVKVGKKIPVILEEDEELPQDKQTRFFVISVDRETKAEVLETLMGSVEDVSDVQEDGTRIAKDAAEIAVVNLGKQVTRDCCKLFSGWENLKNEDGEVITCPDQIDDPNRKGRKVLPYSAWDWCTDMNMMTELLNLGLKANGLGADDTKKSKSSQD